MSKKTVTAPVSVAKRTSRIVANEIAEATDTDVLLYNGPIQRGLDSVVIDMCGECPRPRPSALLILVTEGGNADAAFRIARCLQERYENYSVFVTGWCKSAGTIIALGASELIVSDHGEMGPLDVQLSRKDELFETQSGLTVTSALTTLHSQAFSAFESFMLDTKLRAGSSITTHTAMEIASGLATGLLSGVYAQIDPMHVGEAGRANRVAKQYGEMLIAKSQNSTSENLERLISGYSSHAFVIDRREAAELFNNVREPNAIEMELASRLERKALWPIVHPREPMITFLSKKQRELRDDSEVGGDDVNVSGETAGVAAESARANAAKADKRGA